jgi:hypothetical protein
MGNSPKKLVTWRSFLLVLLALFCWAPYRLYRDYQQAGGWEASSIIATGVTLALGVSIMFAVFWYANRPEPKDKR